MLTKGSGRTNEKLWEESKKKAIAIMGGKAIAEKVKKYRK